MTLSDRLSRKEPKEKPDRGKPPELSTGIEEGLVGCIEKCAESNYPMTKCQLQDLVQVYCVKNNILTDWKHSRPRTDQEHKFHIMWAHRVKVEKLTNIKRSWAKISPDTVRAILVQIAPNLEGVPSANTFNYEETGFRDDPSSKEAFFGGSCKFYKKVRNHSKTTTLVMFCCCADGAMPPPPFDCLQKCHRQCIWKLLRRRS
jgi:hypothetical protein